jgi:hypothetical protein
MHDDQLVTIASFQTIPEAAITQNALEANGISAFLANAETATMAPWLTRPLCVQLQVPAKEVEEAQAILKMIKTDPL